MRYTYTLVPLLASLSATQALAQDAGSLLRDREQGSKIKAPERLPEVEMAAPKAAEQNEAKRSETLLVKQLRFAGKADLLSEAQRAALTASVAGKAVGFQEIRALADEANTALRQQGLLLARAFVPPQDATGGTLTLEISEGVLEEVAFGFAKGSRVKPELVQRIADRHIDRQHLTNADVESALLRINDLPGLSAQSRLAPGKVAGTSRLMVDVAEEPVFSAALFGDNFGSPSTGRAQGHAQLAISDLTGRGDHTRLGFSYSEGQRYASAALTAPISASGLSVSLSYGYLSYRNVDPVGSAAGLRGRAHYGTVGLEFQAIRSRAANLRLTAGVSGKALTDDSLAGRLADKRIVSGSFGLVGDVSDKLLGGGITQLSASWTHGKLDLSRVPAAEFADALGPQTRGKFHRLNAELTRLQSLPGAFSLLLRGSGQWASKNLDSSESFSLGGPYGVRGWPTGEGRGDAGIMGTIELRYDLPLPPKAGALQLSAFADGGKVWLEKRPGAVAPFNACTCNAYALKSAGVGLSWRHDRFNLSASYAHGLGSNPGRSAFDGKNADGSSRRQQVWLSGSIRF